MKYLYRIILLVACLCFLLFSGCTEQESQENEEQNNNGSSEEQQADIPTIPLYTDAEAITLLDNRLWEDFHVDASLEKDMYSSDADLVTLYTWYQEQMDEWTFSSGEMLEEPDSEVSSMGYLVFQSDDYGAFLLFMKKEEQMPIDGETVFGIAQGSWDLISVCGLEDEKPDDMDQDYGTDPVEFTFFILDDDAYNGITPLGDIQGGDHTFPVNFHMIYLTHAAGSTPQDNVYAPADGVITEISYHEYDLPGGSGTYDDYRVYMNHNNSILSYIGHLSALSDTVLSELGTIEGDMIQCSIVVTAGDVIGKTGGSGGEQSTTYWGVLDDSKTLAYAAPERYNRYVHAVSFLQYSSDELYNAIIPDMKDPWTNRQRIVEPLYGKCCYDQVGKLLGNWFEESVGDTESSSEYEKHLCFGYNMWDPSKMNIGIGGTLDIDATVYEERDNSPNPVTITPDSGQVIFELQGLSDYGQQSLKATLLVEMIDEITIQVEAFSGWQSSPSFTSNAVTYIR